MDVDVVKPEILEAPVAAEIEPLAHQEPAPVVRRAVVEERVRLQERTERIQLAVLHVAAHRDLIRARVVPEVVDLERARLDVGVYPAGPVLPPLLVDVLLRPHADVAVVDHRPVGHGTNRSVLEHGRRDLTSRRVVAPRRPPAPVNRADVHVVEAARVRRGVQRRLDERRELHGVRTQLGRLGEP